jgi:IPT/TIG domain
MMAGCGAGQFIPDVQTEDKINLLIKGKFYGHPNAKRAAAQNDPRQCYWHSANSPSDASYTAPLIIMSSSTDGIIEYQADHFDGQLRGNLIAAKYGGGLKRVILTSDGLGVIPESDPALPVVGDGGLSVTQAPDGTLIEVRYPQNTVFYNKPSEATTTALKVNSVFPRRGGLAGGTKLSVYGVNFSANSTVKVGSSNCPVVSTTATKIVCTLPGGSGTVDIVVTGSAGTYTFKKGYRYIKGTP